MEQHIIFLCPDFGKPIKLSQLVFQVMVLKPPWFTHARL